MYQSKKIAVVIPAYNESAAIGLVVDAVLALTNPSQQRLVDQLVVCDNGSNDDTASVARHAGAQVVFEKKPGYGNACLAAIAALDSPDIIVFVDGDHSVIYEDILPLVVSVASRTDLAIGSRIPERNEAGALTPQQIFGNKLACWLIKLFWRTTVTDLGPLRAIRSDALTALNMQDGTYGWTVEMQVKAIQQGMRIEEQITGSRKRIGQSKISGTVKGTIGAAIGIIGMILRLRLRSNTNAKPRHSNHTHEHSVKR